MKQAMAETTDPAAVGKKIADCFRLCFFCNDFLGNNLIRYQDAIYLSDELRTSLLLIKQAKHLDKEQIIAYACVINELCYALEEKVKEYVVNEYNKHFVDAVFVNGTRRLICKISHLQPTLYF